MPSRPCFLVIDPEHAGTLSTRKLVLETAKYNVITAYSATEATDLLRRFPRVDAVVLNAILRDSGLTGFLEVLHTMLEVKLVVVGEVWSAEAPFSPDATVETFAPDKLLQTLRKLFPAESRLLLENEEKLETRERSEDKT